MAAPRQEAEERVAPGHGERRPAAREVQGTAHNPLQCVGDATPNALRFLALHRAPGPRERGVADGGWQEVLPIRMAQALRLR